MSHPFPVPVRTEWAPVPLAVRLRSLDHCVSVLQIETTVEKDHSKRVSLVHSREYARGFRDCLRVLTGDDVYPRVCPYSATAVVFEDVVKSMCEERRLAMRALEDSRSPKSREVASS